MIQTAKLMLVGGGHRLFVRLVKLQGPGAVRGLPVFSELPSDNVAEATMLLAAELGVEVDPEHTLAVVTHSKETILIGRAALPFDGRFWLRVPQQDKKGWEDIESVVADAWTNPHCYDRNLAMHLFETRRLLNMVSRPVELEDTPLR